MSKKKTMKEHSEETFEAIDNWLKLDDLESGE